jgi:peptidoglycan/LPS O-acetylase OafA/YrhL
VGAAAPQEPVSPLVPTTGVRFPLLDSIRGGGCMVVMLAHAVLIAGGVTSVAAPWAAQLGPMFVVCFFVMSAFVLWRPFVAARWSGRSRPSLARYARHRIVRVVPAYWVALVVLGLALPAQVPGVFGSHAASLFGFAQVYSERTAFLGISPAWTLCVDASFYVVLPLLVIGFERLSARTPPRRRLPLELAVIVGLGITCQVVAAVMFSESAKPLASVDTLLGHFDAFAVGMALATVSVAISTRTESERSVRRGRLIPAAWLGSALLIWLCVKTLPLAFGWGPDESTWQYLAAHDSWLAATAMILLVGIFGVADGGWLRRVLGLRPLAWLGEISYGIYIWHLPILVWLGEHRIGWLDGTTWQFALLSAPIAVLAGAASFRFVERPALRLRNARLGRPALATPPGAAP